MPHLLKVQLGWQSLHSQAGVPGVAGKNCQQLLLIHLSWCLQCPSWTEWFLCVDHLLLQQWEGCLQSHLKLPFLLMQAMVQHLLLGAKFDFFFLVIVMFPLWTKLRKHLLFWRVFVLQDCVSCLFLDKFYKTLNLEGHIAT